MTEDHARMLAEDERARHESLDTQRSVLLQAPAGSGKTTVLVRRLLALLATVDQPEQVLAITFTRKAAFEMRERVWQALSDAATGAPGDKPETRLALAALAHAQKLGWQLLESPARLRIQTIDALNQALAGRAPVLSRSGAALQVHDSPEFLYRQAARQTLAAALDDPQLVDAASLMLGRLDNRWARLEGLLADMLAQRAQWLPRLLQADPQLAQRVAASVHAVVNAELAAAMARLPADWLQEGAALAASSAGELSRQGMEDRSVLAWQQRRDALRGDAGDLHRWRRLCNLALKQDGTVRRSVTKRDGVPPGNAAFKRRVLDWLAQLGEITDGAATLVAVRELPDAELDVDDAAALQALSVLLKRAAVELQLSFAAAGRVDFTWIAAAAREALTEAGEPTDLALRFGSSIRHLLIDEFQDTSIEQLQLLRALTAGWTPGDGRTLFAVGDPMQSIYQFRAAEVGLFLQARVHGLGEVALEALELRRNFRSAPPLVEWSNRHFAALFPRSDDARSAAVRFLPALVAGDAVAAGVELHATLDEDPQREAQAIVEVVARVRSRTPAARIAVLVASRKHAVPVVAELTAAGHPVRGLDLQPLRERAVVRDLLALARLLVHAGDRTAWLALLHAPVCGLDLPELQMLAEGDARAIWSVLSDEKKLHALSGKARQALQRVCMALLPAIEGEERHEPLWLRVDRCWLRMGGPATARSARDVVDSRSFIEALAAADPALLSAAHLEELATRLYASPAAAVGAIEVLTMHGAKGLEWDVVIVPALGRRTAWDSEPLLHQLELPRSDGGSDLLLAPMRASAARRAEEGSLARYIARLRRERLATERMRLLYVTATRARRELHWFAAARERDGEIRPQTGSLLHLLWPALQQDFIAALPLDGLPPVADTDTREVRTKGYRLPPEWRLPQAHAVPVQRLPLSLHEPDTTPEYSWVGQTARAIGTIVHRELQQRAWCGTAVAASDATLDHAAALAELGVPRNERPAAGRRIADAVQRTLSDERGRWLLLARQREASSERRLTGVVDGQVVNVIIDRMLVDEEGTRWVIDFKTSSHEGGEVQGFIDSEAMRYAPQLRRYAGLAGALGPEPVRCALYFPLLGVFRELA